MTQEQQATNDKAVALIKRLVMADDENWGEPEDSARFNQALQQIIREAKALPLGLTLTKS